MFIFKIISVIIIAIAGVLGGRLPSKTSFSAESSYALTFGNAFAGGVFLGAGFLHMLPDGIEHFSSLNFGVDYPLALMTAALGFILILIIDKGFSTHNPSEALQNKASFPTILFLVLALHSIIAGMSFGLEKDFLSGLIILIAIIAHKGSAAFALGVSLVNSKCDQKVSNKTIWFFSLATPLGVILGSIIGNYSGNSSAILYEGIFDNLAAGTFVYIATLEIISELFENDSHKLKKIGMILFGFVLMATIAIWV